MSSSTENIKNANKSSNGSSGRSAYQSVDGRTPTSPSAINLLPSASPQGNQSLTSAFPQKKDDFPKGFPTQGAPYPLTMTGNPLFNSTAIKSSSLQHVNNLKSLSKQFRSIRVNDESKVIEKIRLTIKKHILLKEFAQEAIDYILALTDYLQDRMNRIKELETELEDAKNDAQKQIQEVPSLTYGQVKKIIDRVVQIFNDFVDPGLSGNYGSSTKDIIHINKLIENIENKKDEDEIGQEKIIELIDSIDSLIKKEQKDLFTQIDETASAFNKIEELQDPTNLASLRIELNPRKEKKNKQKNKFSEKAKGFFEKLKPRSAKK